MIDPLTRLTLKLLAGSSLPAHWIYPAPPAVAQRTSRRGKLSIEIVSHCWQYSRLLAYQLTSLVQNPVSNATITMTVFYAKEDQATSQLIAFFSNYTLPNVSWNWQPLPRQRLFRRSIGRNIAAKRSNADWIWFTDCDLTFQAGCLDSLNTALQGCQDALVFPLVESKTNVYTDADIVTKNSLEKPELLSVDASEFKAHAITRATGPLQITHGDVARAVGYCADIAYYQKSQEQFQKATEDRVFRWLLGTQGVGLAIEGVCRIQHANKGRYKGNSQRSRWRKRIRQWQHNRR